MNTCKIDNPLTSFTMQGLVKEDNFLASKQAQASKQASKRYII